MHSNLELWLDHPITRAYRKALMVERESALRQILEAPFINQDNIGHIAELKGRINALDVLLDVELLETTLEDILHENVQGDQR